MLEDPVSFAGLHGIDEHASQAKGNLFREYFSHFIYLETVPKVNVDHFPCVPLNHNVERVPITQPDYIADNRHHR